MGIGDLLSVLAHDAHSVSGTLEALKIEILDHPQAMV
jgi:hypothetical protein